MSANDEPDPLLRKAEEVLVRSAATAEKFIALRDLSALRRDLWTISDTLASLIASRTPVARSNAAIEALMREAESVSTRDQQQ
jgi:hypothetical protein